MYHIDDGAVAALTKYYKTVFTEGASVLDIASSWYEMFLKSSNMSYDDYYVLHI